MTTKNLFLIGYRGTGKSALGKIISEKTGMQFIDTDKLIVEIAGKTIPEIFASDGEARFREYETEALKKAVSISPDDVKVISCGGGIITQDRNIPIMKQNGIVCLLTADPITIFRRIYNDKNRPALTNKDPMEEIKHMLEVRGPLYEKAKDFEVNTSTNGKVECVKQIISKYEDLRWTN